MTSISCGAFLAIVYVRLMVVKAELRPWGLNSNWIEENKKNQVSLSMLCTEAKKKRTRQGHIAFPHIE